MWQKISKVTNSLNCRKKCEKRKKIKNTLIFPKTPIPQKQTCWMEGFCVKRGAPGIFALMLFLQFVELNPGSI
jgi:hypothetical protein